jgi:hypothetical protein
MQSHDIQSVCWLDTAKPTRYTAHDERNLSELRKAEIAARSRFADPVECGPAVETDPARQVSTSFGAMRDKHSSPPVVHAPLTGTTPRPGRCDSLPTTDLHPPEGLTAPACGAPNFSEASA